MLVLSRKTGQRIRIGKNIWITLVLAKDGKARIGVEAPREIEVVREEIDDSPPEEVEDDPCPLSDNCRPTECIERRAAAG